MQPFQPLVNSRAGLVITNLGHQRGSRAERRGVRHQPGGAATQDALILAAPLLRDIPDGEPIEGPAHRGHHS